MDVSEGGASGYLAFDENQIEDMRAAIQGYQEGVQEHLNAIKGYAIGAADGVYGQEQINTIDGYIDGTCDAIDSIVVLFDQFKVKLDEVQKAYDAQQRGVSTGEVAKAASATEDDLVTVKGFEDGAAGGAVSGANPSANAIN